MVRKLGGGRGLRLLRRKGKEGSLTSGVLPVYGYRGRVPFITWWIWGRGSCAWGRKLGKFACERLPPARESGGKLRDWQRPAGGTKGYQGDEVHWIVGEIRREVLKDEKDFFSGMGVGFLGEGSSIGGKRTKKIHAALGVRGGGGVFKWEGQLEVLVWKE